MGTVQNMICCKLRARFTMLQFVLFPLMKEDMQGMLLKHRRGTGKSRLFPNPV